MKKLYNYGRSSHFLSSWTTCIIVLYLCIILFDYSSYIWWHARSLTDIITSLYSDTMYINDIAGSLIVRINKCLRLLRKNCFSFLKHFEVVTNLKQHWGEILNLNSPFCASLIWDTSVFIAQIFLWFSGSAQEHLGKERTAERRRNPENRRDGYAEGHAWTGQERDDPLRKRRGPSCSEVSRVYAEGGGFPYIHLDRKEFMKDVVNLINLKKIVQCS